MDYFRNGLIVSGVLNAFIGAGGGARYTVTIGNSGDNYGYNDGTPIGSISPTSHRGATIRVVSNNISDGVGGNTFTVTLNGTQVQSFFTGIEIQKTDGTIQTYYTSSVDTFVAGATTAWQWNTASDLWTSTSPATRSIRIF